MLSDVIGLESEKRALAIAVAQDVPALLIGETGVGKTYLVRNYARELKKTLIRISLNGEIGINELLGKWLVKEGSTYWQDGVLVDAMRKGHWVVLDEINAASPEVLFCLNSLLDDSRSLVLAEKDGELITPHKNFRVFATMNPPEEYAGVKEMNKALLSRFSIVLTFNEYQAQVELNILSKQSGLELDICKVLVDIGNAIRKLKKEQQIWYYCSTRDLVSCAKLMKVAACTLEDVLVWGIFSKAPEADKVHLEKAIKSVCKGMISLSLKHGDIQKLSTDILASKEAYEKLIVSLKEGYRKKDQHLQLLFRDFSHAAEMLCRKAAEELDKVAAIEVVATAPVEEKVS